MIHFQTLFSDNFSETSEKSMDDGKNRSNELEKMQNLAKLIHSMQIVNDHVQSTFIIVFYLLLERFLIKLSLFIQK